ALFELPKEVRDVGRAEATVAGDYRRHSLLEVVAVGLVPRLYERLVGVRVQVDVAGCDIQAVAVNDLWGPNGLEFADGDDALAFDRHVADDAGFAAAVEERAAFEDEIGVHGIGAEGEREEENCSVHDGSLWNCRLRRCAFEGAKPQA